MKIEINKLMKELLSSFDFWSMDNNETKKDLGVEWYILSLVLWEGLIDDSYWEKININYLRDKVEYDKTKDRPLWNSDRINEDDFIWISNKPLAFLSSFILIWIWVNTLKKRYPKENFIFLIQYDKWKNKWIDWWDWDVPAWFFVKAYHKRDAIRLYANINKLNYPYISIEI